MNLCLPKFDWKAETEVIKQGIPMMASLFGGMAISALPAALLVYPGVKDVTLVTVGIAAVVGVAAWLIWRLLLTDGAKRFRRMRRTCCTATLAGSGSSDAVTNTCERDSCM